LIKLRRLTPGDRHLDESLPAELAASLPADPAWSRRAAPAGSLPTTINLRIATVAGLQIRTQVLPPILSGKPCSDSTSTMSWNATKEL